MAYETLDSDDEKLFGRATTMSNTFLLEDCPQEDRHKKDTVDVELMNVSRLQRSLQRSSSSVSSSVYRHSSSAANFSMPPSATLTDISGSSGGGRISHTGNSTKSPSDDEETFDRPDWAERFSSHPLSIMEEAARKSMARGAVQSPSWESWRSDLRNEGREMASQWGSRDKSTRTVPPAFVEEPDDFRSIASKKSSSAPNAWHQSDE